MDFQSKSKILLLLKFIYSKIEAADFRLPVCYTFQDLIADYLSTIHCPLDLATLLLLADEQPGKLIINSTNGNNSLNANDFLLYITKLFDNTLEFNKSVHLMVLQGHHLKYFSLSLFDALFPTVPLEEPLPSKLISLETTMNVFEVPMQYNNSNNLESTLHDINIISNNEN